MKIALAADHAGFELKEQIKSWLLKNNYIKDFGCDSTESIDYPDFGFVAAKEVAMGHANFGILICGSGAGMSIVANKVKGIRAANCINVEMAKLAREHSDANVLTLGARMIDLELAKKIVDEFLSEKFLGGHYKVRVEKIIEHEEEIL
jgi:ribose 5-phosphate isomerase B